MIEQRSTYVQGRSEREEIVDDCMVGRGEKKRKAIKGSQGVKGENEAE